VAILEDSIPGERVLGGEDTGIERTKTEKDIASTEEILFPSRREQHGKRMEQNQNEGGPRIESDDLEKLLKEGWEVV
jgi:hypothetical protein